MKVKTKKLAMITFIGVMVVTSLLNAYHHLASIKLDGLKFEDSLNIKLNDWYADFLHFDYDLDHDITFNDQVNQALLRYKDDEEFQYLKPFDATITIPFYYKHQQVKPLIQPFDPRLTMSVYLHKLIENPHGAIKFHWSDWVDFSKLHKFIFSKASCNQFEIKNNEELIKDSENVLDVKDYCHDVDNNLGFKITRPPYQQTIENNEILGKSFLYASFPPPLKMVLMADEGNFEVNVESDRNDLNDSLLFNGYITPEDADKKLDVNEYYDRFIALNRPTTKLKPTIDSSSFEFNVDEKITFLNLQSQRQELTTIESNYLKSLEFSNSTTEPYKYFFETKLLNSYKEKWVGEHYDWRFFNGLTIGESEQMVSLFKLIKNYLQFCENEGIVTWIAHGTLLSWYWNGLIFPWDTDLDVQLPIKELHKLAENFNQSMVVENVKNGYSKYFIDISSSLTHRRKGNGLNNIDGRFIDVDTGLYVDLTALAITNEPKPDRYKNDQGEVVNKVVNCRNNHFSAINELIPLKRVHFEDQSTFIPNKFLKVLDHEYNIKSISEKIYADYVYIKNLRIWVLTQNILDYLNDATGWVKNRSPNDDQYESSEQFDKRDTGTMEKLNINTLTKNDYMNLIQDKQILKQYLINKNFTSYHNKELDFLLHGIHHNEKVPPSFKLDIFRDKQVDFNEEVVRVMELTTNSNYGK